MEKLRRELGVEPAELLFLVVALGVLSFLPLFTLGVYNDMAMRGSIPSLLVLWAAVAHVLFRADLWRKSRYRLFAVLICATMVMGSYSALVNIAESLGQYHFGPPELSALLTTAEANRPEIVAQRLGDSDSFFFRFLGR
jgi:hypothetical protein